MEHLWKVLYNFHTCTQKLSHIYETAAQYMEIYKSTELYIKNIFIRCTLVSRVPIYLLLVSIEALRV